MRRLSNAEYNNTIRDLTGVDLQPAREFPADGAAGEGFTNAAEALTEISPALLSKYLNASKAIADHAVLLPDGIRFSELKTRRDWTDDATAKLRKFYADHAPADGRLSVQPYLLATVRHRDALKAGQFEDVAKKEKLNAKYLGMLWATLTDATPSQPLDSLRAKWKSATEKDVPALAAEIADWQSMLWKTVRIGSYMRASGNGYAESDSRQLAVDPAAERVIPLRVPLKPTPGQTEVIIRLAAEELFSTRGDIVWTLPRMEAQGKPPLLLRDYEKFGAGFEADISTAFRHSRQYLAAVVALANNKALSVADTAKKNNLDEVFLKRWSEVLAVDPLTPSDTKTTPAVSLMLLDEKTPVNPQWPAISGWRKKGTDLPSVISNNSDAALQIPGRVVAHGVSMHPLPKEFVAVAWKTPVAGEVKIAAKIADAHPTCGNGVAWWLEHRRAGRATALGEGSLDLGKEMKSDAWTVKVDKGDELVLAVDAKNGNHFCDMTEITFTIAETAKGGKTWNLAVDVADTIQTGNPHVDKHGNKDVWSFVRGVTKASTTAITFPADSALGKWRGAAGDPARKADVAKLAEQVEVLLAGARPTTAGPDQALYDLFLTPNGPLFTGVDVTKLVKPAGALKYGLPKSQFDERGNIALATTTALEIKLPVALFRGREFVVDAALPAAVGNRVIRVRAGNAWSPIVLAEPTGEGFKRLAEGNAKFRRMFPLFTCFPNVVPTDEVVSLKMFHREDEPLERLFLAGAEMAKLEALWTDHRFVSRQAALENAYLPQFIGFVTQDQPKAMELFFRSLMPTFQKRADDLQKVEMAAELAHLSALMSFAERAYRRLLSDKDKSELLSLYKAIREKGATHDEAIRGVLAKVLVSPAFLFRIEAAPKGKEAAAVNDWELATRLSYFLWSSVPDDELRALAADRKLRDPKVLAAQTQRMLKDPKARSLAIEFGTQWIHVRGFDELQEKNEKLFPTFTPELRKAIYEESILFFQDLFQSDRAVTSIIDADYTFLNDALAKHYGIPNVVGPQWRKVDGVRKYGRGGVLGQASVLTKEAGASRTSPILRGNWVVETLLGEKLPRPPANVPQLPEVEGADKLTMRQLVEKHTSVASCTTCHVRIDPFGFAMEKFDPIGRMREKELGGLAVDTKAKLKDGTEFEGIDGLRNYLLTKKKDVVVRKPSRKPSGGLAHFAAIPNLLGS